MPKTDAAPVAVAPTTAVERPVSTAPADPARALITALAGRAGPVAVAPPATTLELLRPRLAASADAVPAPLAVADIARPVLTVDAGAPLDATRGDFPQAMIERIEVVRDLADSVDARIRVVPDALGTIDLSVRTEGDVTHVHFAASEPETRALLAEAQPRLAELAGERGMRLGQSSVDAGDRRQPDRPQPAFIHRAPAPARAQTEEPGVDRRLA